MKTAVLLVMLAFPAISQVRFEVTSVRPSRSGAVVQDARMRFQGDRFDATAVTVYDILGMLAGGLFRVEGGPAWLQTDRYDIAAKAPEGASPQDQPDLIMGLLEDRFKLVAHRESRDRATTVLLAPKKLPGLHPAANDVVPGIQFYNNHPVFKAAPMSMLVNYLSQMWHSPVADRTGLTGRFDFTFDPASFDGDPGASLSLSWGDRVRAAVIEFGFKIETQKIPTEITIIDRCERPDQN